MLQCIWQALNPLSFIQVTFTAIVPEAYPGKDKMCFRLIADDARSVGDSHPSLNSRWRPYAIFDFWKLDYWLSAIPKWTQLDGDYLGCGVTRRLQNTDATWHDKRVTARLYKSSCSCWRQEVGDTVQGVRKQKTKEQEEDWLTGKHCYTDLKMVT